MSCSRRGSTRPSPSGPRASSSSCARRTATTPWPTWDHEGRSITESQLEILSAAECRPDTPAQPHHESHHQLVAEGVRHVVREEKRVGGQLGRPSGARFRTYTRLKQYAEAIKGQLFDVDALHKAIDDIYRYPLRQSAVDTLNRQLRSGVDDTPLAEIVMSLREEDRLCLAGDDAARPRNRKSSAPWGCSIRRTNS